jgi:hypothetical protein
MNNDKTKLIGIDTIYDDNADGVYRKHTQDISQTFLDSLAEQRNASKGKREGDFMRVASIPTIIVEKWMREGFNIMSGEHSAAEIVKRLKQENLEAFLTTEKNV